ncbi:MAG: universal stress protein [Ktedonobacterales bacterium]|nr:universal stress protein [Ktedonobacterales bacterium]
MHILVPLDGSPLAERAIGSAARLLRRATGPASLTLLNIITASSVAYDATGFAPPVTESAFQSAIAGGEQYLAQVAARHELADLQVTTLTQMGGTVANDICQVAQERQVDFIVLASHTRTGMTHFFLGSVAEAVMRDAPVPTIIIHRDAPHFPPLGRDEPFTILIPLDGTPLAEAVVVPAIRLAAQVHGVIRVMRVLPTHQGAIPAERGQVAETQAYFAHLRPIVEGQGVAMSENIAWGDVAEHITAVAQEFQTDLLAIATHGAIGLAQLREGSVTLDLLHHLPTPMLIVHPSEQIPSVPTPASRAKLV